MSLFCPNFFFFLKIWTWDFFLITLNRENWHIHWTIETVLCDIWAKFAGRACKLGRPTANLLAGHCTHQSERNKANSEVRRCDLWTSTIPFKPIFCTLIWVRVQRPNPCMISSFVQLPFVFIRPHFQTRYTIMDSKCYCVLQRSLISLCNCKSQPSKWAWHRYDRCPSIIDSRPFNFNLSANFIEMLLPQKGDAICSSNSETLVYV